MHLRAALLVIGLAGAGTLAAIAPSAARLTTGAAGSAAEYTLAAVAVWAWVQGRLWQFLRDQSAFAWRVSARRALGPATRVTLLRGWLVAAVGGFLLLPPIAGAAAVAVGLAYTVVALLDLIDGRIARRTGTVSPAGARLDVAVDALGLLVAPLVAVRAGRLPPWYLLLSLAYPLFQLALAARRRRGRPLFPERLRPYPRAKIYAGVQMGVVAAALYPVLPVAFTWTTASIAMVPTLALFAREWRTVTGR